MKRIWITGSVAGLLVMAMLGLPAAALGDETLQAEMSGYQEVPAISTAGSGEFRGKISNDETSIDYELSYGNLRAPAFAGHIHLGQRGVNGGVSIFLCGGPTTPPCPPAGGTVTGTLTAAGVIGPSGQGIAPGEFDELVRAIRAGATYANVHTALHPGGEVRGQIRASSSR